MTHQVTQADREAAADAVKSYRDQKNGNWQKRIRDGECDDGAMVQAFAKHRQSHTTEWQDKLVEALRPFAEQQTIEEALHSPDKPEWLGATPERRIELMGEKKRRIDANILRAREVLASLPQGQE